MNAASIAMEGPKSRPVVMPKFPKGRCVECMLKAMKAGAALAIV